ncbi:MAG: ATP-binding protein [Pyrinomonadaceae bacterium]
MQEIEKTNVMPVPADSPGDNRILIVDDEELVRNLFAQSLGDRYDCMTAGNAQEALALLAAQPFALVITDVQMPGLSGIELLRKVVADFADVAVIVASGVDRSQRVIDTLRLGASDYLIKPCELDVLEMSVERALERRALMRDGKRSKAALERRNEELASQKTELIRLQAQLIQSEKMASLGQLAGGVAHELNNPCGFIHSNMESLDQFASDLRQLLAVYERVPLSPEFAAQVNALKQSIGFENLLSEMSSIIDDCSEGARRIRDIVLNLRTFSRLDEVEVKQIDIHEGIDSTIRLLSQYYSSNHITLERDYGAVPPVECFAGQLNQVWMNLLTNAAQAIGRGPGKVRIVTRVRDEMVVVRISDTGAGIKPEDMKRVFDPFFTTKPVGEGTGLGLSIIYGIVEKHGGRITVESQLGEGTTFTTVIPLKAQLKLQGREFREGFTT